MNLKEYLKEAKNFYNHLIEYLDDTIYPNDDDHNLYNSLNLHDFNKEETFRFIIHLIANVSYNYQRNSSVLNKIEHVIIHIRDDINKHLSNIEIFNIFSKNKKLILFLIKEKILIIDDNLIQTLQEDKYVKINYLLYFQKEIKILNQELYDNINVIKTKKFIQVEKMINNNIEEFEEKRLIGENDNHLCELIRKDLINEFIQYIEKNNIELPKIIPESIFETNRFLIQKSPTLIEYSTFYNSNKVINYLLSKNDYLTPSLWLYAIHGNNLEMIKNLENKKIKPQDETFQQCLIESIKCHNKELINYFYKKLNQTINTYVFSKSIKYYNFAFFPNDFNDELIFFNLCKYDHISLVKLLLDSSALTFNLNKHIHVKWFKNKENPYKKEYFEESKTPLCVAVEKGNIKIVDLLLNQSTVDVNIKNHSEHFYYYGKEIKETTALHVAIENNNSRIAKLLIENNKVDLNKKYINKYLKNEYICTQEKTPIYMAVEHENKEIVNLLLSKKDIDLNEKFTSKENAKSAYNIEKAPIHLAVEKENQEIIKILLSNNSIDINSQFIENYTSSSNRYYRTKTALHIAAKKKNTNISKLLVSNDKIDINSKYIKKYNNDQEHAEKTALFIAIKKNNVEVVKQLLNSPKIDVNIKFISNLEEIAPLYIAVERKQKEIIEKLLKTPNIDVNIKSSVFRIEKSDEYNSRLFIFKDYRLENRSEKTALHLAAEMGDADIIKILLQDPTIDINIIEYASKKGEAKKMLEGGIVIFENYFNEQVKERTALHCAVEERKEEAVKILLQYSKIDVNHKLVEKIVTFAKDVESNIIDETTSLLVSITNNDFNIFKLLMSHPDINVKINQTGKAILNKTDIITNKSALHIACENNNIEIVKFLLNNSKIDINEKLYSQFTDVTALSIAVEKNCIEIAELLLNKPEINVNLLLESDFSTKTLLLFAIENERHEIVKLLLNNTNIEINQKSIFKNKYDTDEKEIILENIEKTALSLAIENNYMQIIEYLLSNKDIDINIKLKYHKSINNTFIDIEETAFHIAIINNKIDIIKVLLNTQKVDINAKCSRYAKFSFGIYEEEKSAIHFAVKNNNIELVDILLQDTEIDVNSKLIFNRSKANDEKDATYLAHENDIISSLLDNKKMKDILNIFNNKIASINEIVDQKEEKVALSIALENRNHEIVGLLLSNPRIDINIKLKISKYTAKDKILYESEKTLIEIAGIFDITDLMTLINNPKADINTRIISTYSRSNMITKKKERTLFHILIEKNDYTLIDLLKTNRKIDVNSKSITTEYDFGTEVIYENTGLFIAVMENNIKIIKYLLKNPEIDVNSISKFTYLRNGKIFDNSNRTALHLAVQNNNLQAIKLLLSDKRIDISVKNEMDKTAVELTKDPNITSLFNENNSKIEEPFDEEELLEEEENIDDLLLLFSKLTDF